MAGREPFWTDERLEQVVGNLLRVGVLLSAFLVAVGASLYLFRHGLEQVADRHTFEPQPPEFSRPGEIVQAVLHWRGRGLIQFGLLILIATPILRVIVCAYAFLRQRDRVYFIIALIVLAVLLYGLLSGHLV